jgi:hypothetical protein
MDRALKAIIAVSLPIHRHLETLVVIIAASFAFGHRMAPLIRGGEFLRPVPSLGRVREYIDGKLRVILFRKQRP